MKVKQAIPMIDQISDSDKQPPPHIGSTQLPNLTTTQIPTNKETTHLNMTIKEEINDSYDQSSLQLPP